MMFFKKKKSQEKEEEVSSGKVRGKGWRKLNAPVAGVTKANLKRLEGKTDMVTVAGIQRKKF